MTDCSDTSRAGMTINAYCRSLATPWLFDDLRSHLANAGAVPSEEPIPDADSFICIRAQELDKSPGLACTVVQLHSLAWDHHVRYDLLARVYGIVATHPEQLERARANGVDVDSKAVLLRPIGALRQFTLRESMPDVFTAGWVGRPIRWEGRDIKRLHLFVDAVTEVHRWGISIRAMLVGERLHEAESALRKAGVAVEYHPRETTPIEAYPALYQQMDVCVVTAEREPGPLCIYEALACGVPVIGTVDGQAHHVEEWGVKMFLAPPTAEGMAEFLGAALAWRDVDFAERDVQWRSSMEDYWLEEWAAENVELARGLTR